MESRSKFVQRVAFEDFCAIVILISHFVNYFQLDHSKINSGSVTKYLCTRTIYFFIITNIDTLNRKNIFKLKVGHRIQCMLSLQFHQCQ